MGLRVRVARTVVAVLVGTLFVPVGSVVVAPLIEQASANNNIITCSGGGSFAIPNSYRVDGFQPKK